MKFRRFSLLLAVVSAFALGLFAAAPISRLLPPLTGAQRTAIVEEMERSVTGAALMADYYSYGPVDEAFYRGCQYQASVDAELLAADVPNSQAPIAYISVSPSETHPGDTVTVFVKLEDDGDLLNYEVRHVGRGAIGKRAQISSGYGFDDSFNYRIPTDAPSGRHTFEVEVWDRAKNRTRDEVFVNIVGN